MGKDVEHGGQIQIIIQGPSKYHKLAVARRQTLCRHGSQLSLKGHPQIRIFTWNLPIFKYWQLSQNWKTHYDVRQRSNSGQRSASGLPVYHLWFVRKDELAWLALRLSQGSGVALSVERSQNVEQLEWQTQWDIREHTSFIWRQFWTCLPHINSLF